MRRVFAIWVLVEVAVASGALAVEVEPVPFARAGTWYDSGMVVTEAKVLKLLDTIVTNRLVEDGAIKYLEICEPPWIGFDTNDLYRIDETKFPLHGMRPLEWICGVIKSNGMVPGIYLSVELFSPGGKRGLKGHSLYANATNFAGIGFEYCFIESYSGQAQLDTQELIAHWRSTGRPCVWIMSSYELTDWQFETLNDINLTHFMQDNNGSWAKFQNRLDWYKVLGRYVRPGHYLELVSWTSPETFHYANWRSYQSQVSGIAMMSAPRGAFSVMDKIDSRWVTADGSFTNGPIHGDITNRDLMAINMDPLCKPADLLFSNDLAEIYIKPLKDLYGTSKAMWFLNRSTNESRSMTLSFGDIFPGQPTQGTNTLCSVYDVWFRSWLGYTNGLSVSLPPYGSKIYRIDLGAEVGWPIGTNYLTDMGPMGAWQDVVTNSVAGDCDVAKGWRWNGNKYYLSYPGKSVLGKDLSLRTYSGTNYFTHGVGSSYPMHFQWRIDGSSRVHFLFGYDGDYAYTGLGSGRLIVKLDGVQVVNISNIRVGDVITNDIVTDGHSLLEIESPHGGNVAIVDPYLVVEDLSGRPGDDVPAWWRTQYFGHPFGTAADSSRAGDDADGDGLTNLAEWRAGTSPVDFESRFMLANLVWNESGVTLTWQSVSGVSYYVQRSADLGADATFSSIASNIIGQGLTTSYTDTNTPPSGGPFFYRIGLQ